MLVNYVFYQLRNSISSDYSILFVYFNLELYHTLEICAPSITLINLSCDIGDMGRDTKMNTILEKIKGRYLY